MIKNIKLFINKNDKSIKTAKLIKDKLIYNGFKVDDNKYDLAIAIGGDGSFLRMVKDTKFNEDIYYIGINSGTLGFLQEIDIDNCVDFVKRLNSDNYKFEEIGIQDSKVITEDEVLLLIVRSSTGIKHNIRLNNQVGVIDKDYYNNKNNEGHIFIKIQNEGEKDIVINKGDRFAQGIFTKYLLTDDDIASGDRTGGLGSTGKGE